MEKKLKIDVVIKNGNEKIYGFYYHNDNLESQVALILHGNKDNYLNNKELLDSIFESFAEKGFSTLMINFSNTDELTKFKEINSREDFELEKDTEEATVALNWVHERNFESKNYWLCSIGKGVIPTLQLVMRRPEIDNYILLDPIIKKDDLNFIVPCLAHGKILKSESNINFSDEKMKEIQEKLVTKTESIVESEVIFDNDKNIEDTVSEIRSVLDKFIIEKLKYFLKDSQIKTKNKKRRRRKKKHPDSESDIRNEYISPIQSLDIDDI